MWQPAATRESVIFRPSGWVTSGKWIARAAALSPASTSTFTLSCRIEIEVLHAIWQSRSPPYVSTTKIKYARRLPRHVPRTICIIDTVCSFSFSLSATRSFSYSLWRHRRLFQLCSLVFFVLTSGRYTLSPHDLDEVLFLFLVEGVYTHQERENISASPPGGGAYPKSSQSPCGLSKSSSELVRRSRSLGRKVRRSRRGTMK
jgi:hypothetical protein